MEVLEACLSPGGLARGRGVLGLSPGGLARGRGVLCLSPGGLASRVSGNVLGAYLSPGDLASRPDRDLT